ncbi:Sugar kinase of the NBD/HSP70 family, may contain an N-terminal HTH domain [Frankineae bacterium MT45]|nr:Sugar kinase of the NBD/HSP70 family, may contain an N-terminal HTH domain [Frankineae bacterium MT45]
MTAPAGQHTIREHNLALVMRSIADGPRRSRAQLAEATGLTRATISGLVDELITSDLLIELEPDRSSRGRPGSPITLNPNGPAGLGIEVNVDYTSACVVDLTGEVRSQRTELLDNRKVSPEQGMRHAVTLANEVRDEVGKLGIAGATVALPGLVDSDGLLRRAPNLPRWQDLDVAGEFSQLLGLDVQVDNEANLAALAELWYGEPRDDFVLVSADIGIGAGIVLNRRLYRGVRGRAGELGHVVVDPAGPPCGCGSNGCLEQLAGQEALLRAAGVTVGDIGTSVADPHGAAEELSLRARSGDGRTLKALTDAGSALGVALAGMVNLLDIPAIILGGIYADLGDWLMPTIEAELRRRVLASNSHVELSLATLGSGAAVRGSAGSVVAGLIAKPH